MKPLAGCADGHSVRTPGKLLAVRTVADRDCVAIDLRIVSVLSAKALAAAVLKLRG